MSLEQLHRAWQRLAENRIRSAQEEGKFDKLPGFGRPLEEIVDIDDPYGWVRRQFQAIAASSRSTQERVAPADHSREATQDLTRSSSNGNGIDPASSTRS